MINNPIPPITLENYSKVVKMFHQAFKLETKRAKIAHERFNVFTTLLKPGDEVRLHTRFIHCLLDPNGLHDCGPLFQDLFFETLSDLGGQNHDHTSSKPELPNYERPWNARKESRSHYGQMDILLECQGFGIAIENKIHAGEGSEQLFRYHNHLSEFYAGGGLVIYLTLDGSPSATHGDKTYLRISYEKHILAWLEKCLHETLRITPIQQALLQYRDVVRQLTGKTFAKKTMNQTADFIRRNPDVVRYRAQMSNAIEMVRADLFDRLADEMMKSLDKAGYNVAFRNNLRDNRFGIDMSGAFIITPMASSVLSQMRFAIWVERNAANSLYVGIKYPDGGYKKHLPEEDRQVLERMRLFLDQDPESSANFTRFPNESWPTGLRRLIDSLDDVCLADFLDKPTEITAADLSQGIFEHMQALEHAYVSAASPDPVNPSSHED